MKRSQSIIAFIVGALGAFVALRAFGIETEAVTHAVSGATDVVNTVTQNPKASVAVFWTGIELWRRIMPTLNPSSPTLTLFAQLCVLGIAILTAFRDFFLWVRDNDGMNVLKKEGP